MRGPLTRKALLQKGLDCPEHYGDPALLLPVFYRPSVSRSVHISIIPNEGTYYRSCPIVDELIAKYDCKLINMTNYEKWTDIIDATVSSAFVISESLHGLIIAEAYNIPCVWVEFLDHKNFNDDWSFKFRDFYESIGKHDMSSIKLYEGFNFDDLLAKKDEWHLGRIDYQQLVKYLPFSIKPELQSAIKFPLKP